MFFLAVLSRRSTLDMTFMWGISRVTIADNAAKDPLKEIESETEAKEMRSDLTRRGTNEVVRTRPKFDLQVLLRPLRYTPI